MARRLWASGNTDARILAALIADPAEFGTRHAEKWLEDVCYFAASSIESAANRRVRPKVAAKKTARKRTAKKQTGKAAART